MERFCASISLHLFGLDALAIHQVIMGFNLILQLLYSIPILGNHRNNASLDACVKLLGGGLAGLTAASIAYPLDLVKTRLSVQVSLYFLHSN